MTKKIAVQYKQHLCQNKMVADTIHHVRDSPLNTENVSTFCTSDHQYCELLKSEVQVLHKEVKSLTEI
jgi:hypothetical protein